MKKLIFAAILTIFVSCNKDEPYTPTSDPKQAILGKWELIELGVGGVTEPYKANRSIEYLEDSTMIYYYYDTKEYIVFDCIYWIDSLLCHGSYDKTIVIEYSYKFYEDKMWLQYVNFFSTFDTFIYQRKK
ncbi:MAG: hypothetical protein M0Q41_13850 [Bacteroidales bacterium]|nr:hypothetical protein [Bacteroidales bacterium]MDD3701837.1 hypothetical protein [Bacteroidales bacterium]